jgi:hypothetical protein
MYPMGFTDSVWLWRHSRASFDHPPFEAYSPRPACDTRSVASYLIRSKEHSSHVLWKTTSQTSGAAKYSVLVTVLRLQSIRVRRNATRQSEAIIPSSHLSALQKRHDIDFTVQYRRNKFNNKPLLQVPKVSPVLDSTCGSEAIATHSQATPVFPSAISSSFITHRQKLYIILF